jgi:hypothetical protein
MGKTHNFDHLLVNMVICNPKGFPFIIEVYNWRRCTFILGLDNSICTFGGLLSYKKNPSLFTTVPEAITLGSQETKQFNKNIIENIAVPRNLRILLINTKVNQFSNSTFHSINLILKSKLQKPRCSLDLKTSVLAIGKSWELV